MNQDARPNVRQIRFELFSAVPSKSEGANTVIETVTWLLSWVSSVAVSVMATVPVWFKFGTTLRYAFNAQELPGNIAICTSPPEGAVESALEEMLADSSK